MALDGLVALLSGLLGGYGQGRQVATQNQMQQAQADAQRQQFAQDLALRKAQADAQQNEFNQDLAFRQQQADTSQKQFNQDLATRGVMAFPAFVKNLRGVSPDLASGAVSSFSGAFPGTNLPTTVAPGALGPDVETAQGQAAVAKAIGDIQQGAVGTGSANQKATGEATNALLKAAGLPEQPVPFTPTGQTKVVPPDFSDVLGGLLGGNPDVNTDTKQFQVLNPGFSPSPQTAHEQAQTSYVNTEASTLPQKVQAEVMRLRQEGQFKQADLLLQSLKLQADNANAAANRQVQLRGQDVSATTSANGQAVTQRGQDLSFAGKSSDQAAMDRRTAQTQIDGIAAQRDKTMTTMRGYQAILTSGVNPKTGQPLTDAEKTVLSDNVNGLNAQVNQHNTDIRSLKERAGIINPRDGSTGQFVSPGSNGTGGNTFTRPRTIKTSSGNTLVATPAN